MADRDHFAWGGAAYPLTTSTANSLLRDADPALFYVLDFFKSVLTTYLEPRLLVEASACGAPITAAVKSTVNVEPYPNLFADQFTWPMLAAYRLSEKDSEFTSVWAHDASEWEIAYVLPALTPVQTTRLYPALRAAGRIIADRLRLGFDPAYGAGLVNAWASAGIERLELTGGRYGGYQHVELPQIYHAWTGSLIVTERSQPVSSLATFAGIDVQLGITDATGTTDDVVDIATDVG